MNFSHIPYTHDHIKENPQCIKVHREEQCRVRISAAYNAQLTMPCNISNVCLLLSARRFIVETKHLQILALLLALLKTTFRLLLSLCVCCLLFATLCDINFISFPAKKKLFSHSFPPTLLPPLLFDV